MTWDVLLFRLWFRYLFFFFQAEDGIRDVAVTGVQTCALPISGARELYELIDLGVAMGDQRCDRDGADLLQGEVEQRELRAVRQRRRSEERRVGKECRSRWSPYH